MSFPKMNIKKQGLSFEIKDEPFSVSAANDENRVLEIPNEKIIENDNQHFTIHEDTVEKLAERIKSDGQLTPCIVAPLPDGNYELIDGRHRRRAVIMAGLPTTKCIVMNNLSDKEKSVIRITSNLFRNNNYKPSEIAFSLKELEQLEGTYDAVKKISDETNTNRKKVYRYLRLTNLTEPLLERVDNGEIPVIAAVELSYLDAAEQEGLNRYLLKSGGKITTERAKQIHDNPQNLEEIFNPAEKENSNSDNLSNFGKPENSSAKPSKDENSDNISDEISELAAKAAIDVTGCDYLMIALLCDSSEWIQTVKRDHKNLCHYSDGTEIYFDNHILFRTNGVSYKFSYKQLEAAVRKYIRENYSVEDFYEVIAKGGGLK